MHAQLSCCCAADLQCCLLLGMCCKVAVSSVHDLTGCRHVQVILGRGFLIHVAAVLDHLFRGHPTALLYFVMVMCPLCMNLVQVWYCLHFVHCCLPLLPVTHAQQSWLQRCIRSCTVLAQALVQDAVLKFKKDGKSSPKTQQSLESDTQHLLSPRNASAGGASQQTRSSPVTDGRNIQQV